MVLKRIMPCLLVQNRRLVKTVNFSNPNYIGDPINALKIFNAKEVDELIILDILAHENGINFDLIEEFASECFMPLSYGGGVNKMDDFKKLFRLGIEKIIVNSMLFEDPKLVREASNFYGAQSIVASIDVKLVNSKDYVIFSHNNKNVGMSLNDFVAFVQELGVGEIMLTSVNNEGKWIGYDYKLIEKVSKLVNVPLIVHGGCGKIKDITKVLDYQGVQAAAIGSMAVYHRQNQGVLIKFPYREQVFNNE